jgi:hypothetical protein
MEKSRPSKRPIETVHLNCYLCGSSENVLVASGVDREYYTTDDVFHVVECVKCGLRFLNPRPTVAELDTIYPPDYYSYNMDSDPADLGLALQLRHKVHGRRIRSLLSHLDNRPQIDSWTSAAATAGCSICLSSPIPAHPHLYVDIIECAAAGRAVTRFIAGYSRTSIRPAVRRHQPVERDRARHGPGRRRQEGIRPLRSGGILILKRPTTSRGMRGGSAMAPGARTTFRTIRSSTLDDTEARRHGRLRHGGGEIYTGADAVGLTLHNVLLRAPTRPAIGADLRAAGLLSSGLKPLVLLSSSLPSTGLASRSQDKHPT